MAWQPLVALVLFAYAAFVIYIAATKKPEKVWDMAKIRAFRKVLGEQGTVIFFYIWAVAFVVLGVLLMTIWA